MVDSCRVEVVADGVVAAGPAQAPDRTITRMTDRRQRGPGAYRLPATTAYGSDVAAVRCMLGTALLGVLMAACGSSGTQGAQVRAGADGAASTTVPPVVTTVATSTSTTPPPLATTAVTRPPPAPATATAPPTQLDQAGGAGQAVLVTAAGYGSTTATFSTWQRTGDGWAPVHGPWTAYLGRAGFAPPGEKREGDGRTPSGIYGFQFRFGVRPDPGGPMPYRQITDPTLVWVDDPASPQYNLLVDTAVHDPRGHGEAMLQSPAYDYGAVIDYNADRTPGLGSAIFLHVSVGAPTAGCASLPADRLLEVLRWLDPARSPVIVMGVA